ncbi:MAG: hypothetical protein AAF431_17655 [Pseudomonadota bacterium]
MNSTISLKLVISYAVVVGSVTMEVSACQFDPKSFKLKMSTVNEGVELRASNHGDDYMYISGGFDWGGKVSISPIEIQIMDLNQNKYLINGVVNSHISRSEIKLDRGHSYGRIYKYSSMVHYFELVPGDYLIRAKYEHDRFRRHGCQNVEPVFSNWEEIEIQ